MGAFALRKGGSSAAGRVPKHWKLHHREAQGGAMESQKYRQSGDLKGRK